MNIDEAESSSAAATEFEAPPNSQTFVSDAGMEPLFDRIFMRLLEENYSNAKSFDTHWDRIKSIFQRLTILERRVASQPAPAAATTSSASPAGPLTESGLRAELDVLHYRLGEVEQRENPLPLFNRLSKKYTDLEKRLLGCEKSTNRVLSANDGLNRLLSGRRADAPSDASIATMQAQLELYKVEINKQHQAELAKIWKHVEIVTRQAHLAAEEIEQLKTQNNILCKCIEEVANNEMPLHKVCMRYLGPP